MNDEKITTDNFSDTWADLAPTAEPLDIKNKFADGIYFGLPEADYHAAPGLSASGSKNMMISAADFWHRSWMNPDREDKSTAAQMAGKARHCRIFEGRAAFEGRFYFPLDKADYPGLLVTVDDMAEYLKSALTDDKIKTPKKKADIIEFITANFKSPPPIWDLLTAEHEADNEGKESISRDVEDNIEIQAVVMANHLDVSKLLVGGVPEVSIFWTCTDTGIPMKSRIDYIAPTYAVDLKNFANPLGKPVRRAIVTAMANGRSHIQCSMYLEAIDRAIEFAFKRQCQWRGGDDDLSRGNVEDFTKELGKAETGHHHFVFVFYQTTGAPLVRAIDFPREIGTADIGRITISMAKDSFLANFHRYGEGRWFDNEPLDRFDDDEFPYYMTD